MHALVVEAVMRLAEIFLECGPIVERGIVFSRHEADSLDVEAADDVAHLGHAAAALLGIVGRVRQVAGEDDEVGRRLKRVHCSHGFLQGIRGFGIGIARVAPMCIGELHEIEVLVSRVVCPGLPIQPGHEHGTATGGSQFQKFATIDHDGSPGCGLLLRSLLEVSDQVGALLWRCDLEAHFLPGNEFLRIG